MRREEAETPQLAWLQHRMRETEDTATATKSSDAAARTPPPALRPPLPPSDLAAMPERTPSPPQNHSTCRSTDPDAFLSADSAAAVESFLALDDRGVQDAAAPPVLYCSPHTAHSSPGIVLPQRPISPQERVRDQYYRRQSKTKW